MDVLTFFMKIPRDTHDKFCSCFFLSLCIYFFADDLSVFTLDRSVEFNNNIRPACLWSGNIDLSNIVGDTGVVSL